MEAFVVFLISLALSPTVKAAPSLIFGPETDQENRCGGAFEADTGSLTFPDVAQEVKPDELCVFIIHLQTTSMFRFNFTRLDITGDDENCTGGAVGTYSMTNLIPASKAESFTFCNEQPPTPNYYFLSGDLLTVIFRTDYHPPGTGTGFTLNWEGIAVQPIPKIHESTYTSAASVIIRHPIDGEYLPNRVSTWLVSSRNPLSDENTSLRLNSPYVDLEQCSIAPAENCYCDALIVYEVSTLGKLKEVKRLCGTVGDTEIQGLGRNFILAFFSDHIDEPELGRGFELTYRPESDTTTPPTTTPSRPTTSPRPPPRNTTSTCGGVLTGTSGSINYRPSVNYRNFERCVWQIRTQFRTEINFTIQNVDLDYSDYVVVQTLGGYDIIDSQNFTGFQFQPISFKMVGTVAIVIFHSNHDRTSYGFRLSFVADGPVDDALGYYDDFNFNSRGSGYLRYPESDDFTKLPELSTFVISRPTGAGPSNIVPYVKLNFLSLQLQADVHGICKDVINIYALTTYGNYALLKLTDAPGICQASQIATSLEADTIIIVLLTNGEGNSGRFEIEWEVWPPL